MPQNIKVRKEMLTTAPKALASGGAAKWIQGAHIKKGALHRQLGVPEGQKIPAAKLAKASHSDNPTLARRANLAKTLGKMHHGG